MSRSSKRKAAVEPVAQPVRKLRKTSEEPEDEVDDDAGEDDFTGFGDDAGASDDDGESLAAPATICAPPTKRKKAKKSTPAPPVAELKTVFEGSTIKLQVDSLLASVRPSTSKAAPLHSFIDALRTSLLTSPAIDPSPVAAAVKALRKRGVAVPFPEPKPANDVQWKLAYEPPSSVDVIGSWPLNGACKWKGADGWAVDIALRMPDTLFQANDVKAYRYLHKRAFFLAAVAAHLQESDLAHHVTLTFDYLNGDARKPVIEIRAHKDLGEHDFSAMRAFIRLIPVYDVTASPLRLARLSPSKGNVRASADADAEDAIPSPSYNAAILFDGLVSHHQAYLLETAQRAPHFGEACMLLKIWAHQRGYGASSAHDSECGLEGVRYLLTMLLAHLLSRGGRQDHRLPMRADAWQLFRGCLDFLAHADFVRKPVFMRGGTSDEKPRYPESDFTTPNMPVLVEPAGLVNLLTDVPPAALELLRVEAAATLQVLVERNDEGFETALLRPLHARHLRFDNSASVRLAPQILAAFSSPIDAPAPLDALVRQLSSVVRRAIGTRGHAISLSRSAPSPRSLKASENSDEIHLTLGVSLNSAEAGRLVDFGPSAEDEEAAKDFRGFWGEKCELRRFKDGSILESVVWAADTPLARGAIAGQILRYVFSRSPHFQLPAGDVDVFAAPFDGLLSDPAKPPDKGFSNVQVGFDALSKALRSVKGLPLALSSITPASEALRYSSVFVPSSMTKTYGIPLTSRFVPVMDVHLAFETSSRWPADLEGIQKVKAALLTKLGERLRAGQVEGERFLQVEMAFEVDAPAEADNVSLEVMTPAGLAFRLRVHHDVEADLLDTAALEAGRHTPAGERYLRTLTQHDRRFSLRPRHHAAIAALQHRHASFSAASRILKRWFGAHLLSPHMAPEAIELLMAHVYLSPGGRPAPASGATAFARALDVLRSWDWRASPLLVPVYTAVDAETTVGSGRVTFPADKAAEALKLFETMRKQDPLVRRGALLLATELDLAGKAWTWEAPSRIVVARIAALAGATLDALDEGLRSRSLQPRQLFATPLDAFDFLIYLDRTQLPRHSQALDADPTLLSLKPPASANASRPPLGFDPAQLLVQRAQAFIGDAAMLFHDVNGGHVVAGVFDPALTKPREWRVHLGFSCRPIEGDGENAIEGEVKTARRVALDREGLLAGVKRLGGGLIERIEMRGV